MIGKFDGIFARWKAKMLPSVVVVAVAVGLGWRTPNFHSGRMDAVGRIHQRCGATASVNASNSAAFRGLAKKFSHRNFGNLRRVAVDGGGAKAPSMRLLNKYQYRRTHGGGSGIPTVEVGRSPR
jgi:hypothetical protein